MEADVRPDTKTRKRTEDAAADRAKSGDKSSSAQVDHDPMCLTSFGDDSTEPPTLPLRGDALVDKGAAAPKPCPSSVKIRTPTAAGDLLPAGTASTTVTRTLFHQPPLWSFCPTEEMNFRTSIQYATYSSFWKILEMKTRQTLVFDPGGCTGRLRACLFLRGWCTLLFGEVFVWTLRWCPGLERFW